MDNKSSTSSRSPGDVEGEPVAKKTRLVHRTIIYDESVANQWLDEPPLEVWDHHIIPLEFERLGVGTSCLYVL